MDPGPFLIDTNVFVIDGRYRRDRNYAVNRRFLDFVKRDRSGFTTTINLLELCGILSFNLNEQQLQTVWDGFAERYGVGVLPVPAADASLPPYPIRDVLGYLRRRMALGDALFLLTANRHLAFARTLVTWDREHFTDRFPGHVATPADLLTDT